jgi:O-acetyl-ADP-ribose deacetylase (regulator of RNase III)
METPEINIAGRTIRLVRGDITREHVDAIVNAANASLRPGGGVCGAIHAAGGPAIAEECRRIVAERGPLSPGQAVATGAGDLPARSVIHALGPVWYGGERGEPAQLHDAYANSVSIADHLGYASIAFPSISTGIYGYPVAQAARTAVQALRDALARAASVRDVRIVIFDDSLWDDWAQAMR